MPTPTQTTTPTKRTASPKPAEQKPAAIPAAEPVRKREWNRAQELLADAVGDMLINGGHDNNMAMLIAATADHYARRTYAYAKDLPEKFNMMVREECARLRRDWAFDLETAARLNQRAPEPERQAPADVSAKVREEVRGQVANRFRDFLAQGSPTELFLMNEVLLVWDSRHYMPSAGDDNITLAMGFQSAIGDEVGVVKVPYHLITKVQRYLDALREVEGREV